MQFGKPQDIQLGFTIFYRPTCAHFHRPGEGAAVNEREKNPQARLMWSEFMLHALLKHCLAMPIHNSDSDSALQPPLHSSSNYQINPIDGESNLSAVTTWWKNHDSRIA
jgi:hypothetical protein